MKPIKLSIEGLNSFKEAQVIEFDKLTQYGLFGVFGPTGSGKSSLLDGITLALYGKTSRDSSNFINVECEKMQVSFEFMVNHQHYRVVRTYKRNKQGKVNASKPTRIELVEEGITTLLEEQTTHVDKACFEIIGLEFKDFIRTVVLPQGKFSEFIQLKGKDRREMLERLFALSKYGDDLSRKLSSVIRAEKDKALALSGELKGYESVSKAALKELNELDEEVSKSFDEKKRLYDKNNEAYETSKKLLELSLSLDIEIDKMAHLKLEEPAIIIRKEILKEARKIVQVLPYYTQSKSLEGDIKEKSMQHLELQEKYNKAKKLLDSHQEQFTEIETTHNDFMSKYDVKHLRLVEGIKQLELLKKTDDEKVKLETTIKLQTAEIKGLELQKVSIEDDIAKVKKVISDFETILQANELSLEVQKSVDEGVALELSLTQVEKEILEVSKSDEKDDIEKKKNSILEKTVKCDKLEKDIKDLLIEDHDDYLEKRQEVTKSIEGYTQLSNDYEILEKSITSDTLLLNDCLKDINLLEPTYLEYEKNKEKSLIHKLQEKLEDGQSCPVCGSTDHEYQLELVTFEADNTLETKMDDLTYKAKSLKDQLENNESKISELKEKLSQFDIKTLKNKESKLIDDYALYNNYSSVVKELSLEIAKDNSLLDILSQQKAEKSLKLEDLKEKQISYQSTIKSKLSVVNYTSFALYKTEIYDQLKRYETAKSAKELEVKKLDVDQENLKTTTGTYDKVIVDLKLKKQQLEQLTETIKVIEEKLVSQYGEDRDLLKKLTELDYKHNSLKQDYNTSKQLSVELQKSYELLRDNKMQIEANISSLKTSKVKADETLNKELLIHDLNLTQLIESKWTSESINREEQTIDAFMVKKQTSEVKINTLKEQLGDRKVDKEELNQLFNQLTESKEGYQIVHKEKIRIEKDIQEMTSKLSELKELIDKRDKIDYKLSLLKDLESLFKGKKFVEFVAAYQLRYISIEASKRLLDITSGKYGLEVDDHGMFLVRDYSHGGQTRDMSTLSGGESFLVSLSLALSLSAQIQLKGTAPLELFFLDEGFGTLDERFLELVMSSLEQIHHTRLSVGLISHVDSIKNRVPIKLIVTPSVTGERGSRVKVEKS